MLGLNTLQGNQDPYNELLDQFNFRANQSNPTSVAQLRLWISALSNVVSKLDSRYAKLVESILSLPWSTLDTTFVKVYIHFVGLLVSARPEYLASTLDKCVEGFRYGKLVNFLIHVLCILIAIITQNLTSMSMP
jgi:RNA polymerase I-specific transcription initiation factor RRN3